jgi:hypothetical protein
VTDKLISPEYQAQCEQYHKENPAWGSGPAQHFHRILNFLEEFKSREVIDYGCGKGMLSSVDTKRKYRNYDPCVPQFKERPLPTGLLVCVDVLEHIEPESIDAVLEDIGFLTMGRCLLVISTVPAHDILPDGRNAHISLYPYEWWFNKLAETFRVKTVQTDPSFVSFTCIPKRLYVDVNK